MKKNRFWWKELSTLQKQLYRQLYKKSFYAFVKDFWFCIEDREYVDGVLVEYYCEMAQYLARWWISDYKDIEIKIPELNEDTIVIDVRGDKKNVCINIPPRHSKSIILNIMFGVWIWLWASIDFASVSHNQRLAGRMNAQRQKLMNSEMFKFFFPEIQLIQNTAFSLRDNRGGEMYSVPMAAMLGHGCDIAVLDDLTNAEQAAKGAQEMQNAWEFYKNTLPSRANDINKVAFLNVQQRLNVSDITGRIMEDAELASQYKFIVLPAIFSKHTLLVFPITGKIIEFFPGDYLWPERFGDYSSLRAQVGENVFMAEYLQKPQYADSSVIKESMIIEKPITEVPSIDEAEMVYASHDFPVKVTETSDFLGSVIGYKVNANLYIYAALEEKKAFVESINYVQAIDAAYSAIQVIEDKANGAPILQQLQEYVPGMQAYEPGSNNKKTRLEMATVFMVSQNVIFIQREWNEDTGKYQLAPDLRNLKKELLAFPFLQHDDVVDAFSQIVNFVFMDRRFRVYARSFNNELNIYDSVKISEPNYSTIFFNKEGDTWKVLDIGIEYGMKTTLYVKKETQFKATVTEAISIIKDFAGGTRNVFIDCSTSEALYGVFQDGVSIERYEINDFDKSVSDLTMAFSNRTIIVERECKLLRADIENFKFAKSKDENTVKYRTQKDGFVACLRIAMHYYGGIV